MNVMLAIGACFAYGINVKEIQSGVKSFFPIAHRLEFVAEKKGVSYINDTAATNPQSALTPLQSFDKPIILIAGGADKDLFYEDFAKVIIEKVKGVVFFKGEATNKIISQIKKFYPKEANRSFEIVDSMEKAVEIASRNAESGDIILLSPGAAVLEFLLMKSIEEINLNI